MSAATELALGLDRAERAALADAAGHVWQHWFPLAVTKERAPTEPLDRDAWRGLCGELELPGLRLSADSGGSGLGLDHLTVMAQAAGTMLAPAPWLETVAVVVPVLAALAPDGLPPVLSGETVVAVVRDGAEVVPWGADADRFLLLEADGTASLSQGAAEPLAVVDTSRPQARVSIETGSIRLLGRLNPAPLYRDELVLVAAEAIGAATEFLTRTLAYVKVREQFGHPVGSFQAVQHRLAEFYGELESATAAVWGAVASAERQLPDELKEKSALVAWLRATEVAELIGRECLHLHGGIGFTWEHDAHLFFKRGLSARAGLGGPSRHLRRLAELLG